jgi:opacity protein-like surface antigen
MKRFASLAALLPLGALLAGDPASAGIGVRVSGGLSYVSYGDFNDFAEYINAEVLAASEASGEIGAIHWVPEFQGEIVLPIAPMLDLGIGVGIIMGSSEFGFEVSGDRFDYEHTVKAYPVTATGYVDLPLLPFARPYAFGGGGLYYTKLTFGNVVTIGGTATGYDAELTKWGFGLHGGAGLSFSLSPMVTFDIGVKGRWAKIAGFEGSATTTDGEVIDVFLASYVDDEDELVFGPEATVDKGAYDEGAVDLSGFAFTLTLVVAF